MDTLQVLYEQWLRSTQKEGVFVHSVNHKCEKCNLRHIVSPPPPPPPPPPEEVVSSSVCVINLEGRQKFAPKDRNAEGGNQS
jgi:hypothetical protein